jgi:hypothetical protein
MLHSFTKSGLLQSVALMLSMWFGVLISQMKGRADRLPNSTETERSGILPSLPLRSFDPIDSSVLLQDEKSDEH